MPTSPDWSAELQEALWQAARDYGVHLEVGQQVTIARTLARLRPDDVTAAEIEAAFEDLKLARPPTGYVKAVLASVQVTAPKTTLLDVLLAYRRFAIRSLSRQFGGKTKGHEDELRNNLLTFLQPRGYTEAHTGRGRTDILVPPPKDTIIETKVWTDERTYRAGVEELGRYVHTEQPKHAYIVVFGDREPLPAIVTSHREERAADEHVEGLTVPVVVVQFEVDAPSKAAAQERRRERGER